MSEPSVLCRLLTALDPESPDDCELLARFAANRDAAAFELLVWRHASLVLRACRGILRDRHTAEDATQATFLTLARQASSVGRGGSVASWLFRVARRVAICAARKERRTATKTGFDLDRLPLPEEPPMADPDSDRILHEELARLSETYRAPILLCYFTGLTHTEAARRLGWPVGTVAGRLSRARDLLADRLTRRGVGLAVLTTASAVVVPPAFAATTARAALVFVARGTSGLPGPVVALANREVRAMIATKALRTVGTLAACALMALGVVWAADKPQPPPASATAALEAPPPRAEVPMVAKAVIDKRFAIAPVTTDLQRLLLPGENQKWAAVVFVDGTGLFLEPKVLDLDALNLKGIRTALKTYRPAPERAVYFLTNYRQGNELHRDGTELLRLGLDGLGRQAGFGQVTSYDRVGFDNWDEWVAPLKDERGADAEEAAVGDDRVRAYPVRTPLSRVLTGSADGVIKMRVQLDPGKDDWVPAEVEKSAHATITALKLPKGKVLVFYFSIDWRRNNLDKDGAKRNDLGIKIQKLARQWAEDHELTYGYVSY
jgi:RNA polymerase sigma factor (sigma-70 family)